MAKIKYSVLAITLVIFIAGQISFSPSHAAQSGDYIFYEDNDPLLDYSDGDWQTVSDANALGGQLTRSNVSGATITFRAQVVQDGEVSIRYTRAPDAGTYVIDWGYPGLSPTLHNANLSQNSYNSQVTLAHMNEGTYTITITNDSGAMFRLEAIRVRGILLPTCPSGLSAMTTSEATALDNTCQPPPICPVRNDPNFVYCLAGIDVEIDTVVVGVPEFGSIVCDTIIVDKNEQGSSTSRARSRCQQLRSWKVQLVSDHGAGSQVVGNPQWNNQLLREIYYGVEQVVTKLTEQTFVSLLPADVQDARAGLGYISFVLDTTTSANSAMFTSESISMIEIYANGQGFNKCSDDTQNCPKAITRYVVSHELMHLFNSKTGLASYQGCLMGRPQIDLREELGDRNVTQLAEPFYPPVYGLTLNNQGNGPCSGDRLEDTVELLNLWIWHGEPRNYSVVPLGAWLDVYGDVIPHSTELGFNDAGLAYQVYIESCIAIWATGDYCN